MLDDEDGIRKIEVLEVKFVERSLLMGCDRVASVLEHRCCHDDRPCESEFETGIGHFVAKSRGTADADDFRAALSCLAQFIGHLPVGLGRRRSVISWELGQHLINGDKPRHSASEVGHVAFAVLSSRISQLCSPLSPCTSRLAIVLTDR